MLWVILGHTYAIALQDAGMLSLMILKMEYLYEYDINFLIYNNKQNISSSESIGFHVNEEKSRMLNICDKRDASKHRWYHLFMHISAYNLFIISLR